MFAWQEKWHGVDTVRNQFSQGVRRQYIRVGQKLSLNELKLHENGAYAWLENQFKPSMVLQNNSWQFSCNCNFQTNCVHSYYLANTIPKNNTAIKETKKTVDDTSHNLIAEIEQKDNYDLWRFYDQSNDFLSLLSTQMLHRLIKRFQLHNKINNYNTLQLEFISLFQTFLEQDKVLIFNHKSLKVPTAKRNTLISKGQGIIIRDRITQANFLIEQEANIVFHLEKQEKIKIKCFIETCDKIHDFYKLYKKITNRKIALNNISYKVNYPLEEATLVDCFSKGHPSIDAKMLSLTLPVILENKLYLIQGDNISFKTKEQEISLSIIKKLDKYLVQPNINFNDLHNSFIYTDIQCKSENFIITRTKYINLDKISKFLTKHTQKIDNVFYLKLENLTQDSYQSLPIKYDKKSAMIFQEQQLSCKIKLTHHSYFLAYKVNFYYENQILDDFALMQLRQKNSLIRLNNQENLLVDIPHFFEQYSSLTFKQSRKLLLIEAERLSTKFLDEDSKKILLSLKENQPNFVLNEYWQNFLRPYQQDGVKFLYERMKYNIGILLADDMGLGKTAQSIALIDTMKLKKSLIVAPSSLLYIWQQELDKHTNLSVIIINQAKEQRKQIYAANDYQVLIISYNLLRIDYEDLLEYKYDLILLDEAQYIKNIKSQIFQKITLLKSDYKLALSGTPIENNINDLFALVSFLNPNFFDMKTFKKSYEENSLEDFLAIIMLRRLKTQVAKELPEKTIEVIPCPLDKRQQELYKATLLSKDESTSHIFAKLTRLRQICVDSSLVCNQENTLSLKMQLLFDKLEILQNEKVLIFSQFTKALALIELHLTKNNRKNFTIQGSTSLNQRKNIITTFQESVDNEVLLLSLKAAGTGLTLTKANYVFFIDPWWNHAAEMQAIDRTHRIGQHKNVFIYKLITKGTIEEKVLELQAKKKSLSDNLITSSNKEATLSKEDFDFLLRYEE